ncbi:MAG: CARDB domain-containing protein [Bacteroidota bacterium]
MTSKNSLFFFIATLLYITSFGQTYEDAAAKALIPIAKTVQISKQSSVPSFIVFEEESQMTVEEFKRWEQSTFHYEDGLSFKTRKTVDRAMGTTHIFRDQFYHNIPIEQALSVIHHKNGRVVYTNGTVHNRIGISTDPYFSEADVTALVLAHLGIDTKAWQRLNTNSEHERTIYYQSQRDELKHALIIYQKDGQYHLAWKSYFRSRQFDTYEYIYTDAQTGKVIHTNSALLNCNVGTAETTYRGNQQIQTDNRIINFILHNDCGNADIRTRNEDGVDFANDDNIWDENDNIQRAARTAHFGVTGAFDYFEARHGQIGMDGSGTVDVEILDWANNAFFDPETLTLRFGMGSDFDDESDDRTAPDICGHEFTHGVLFATGGITDFDNHETASLHEGIADIFGNEVEAFMDNAAPEWSLFEDMEGFGVRFLDNPNADIHPFADNGSADTYLGNFWTGSFQHGDGGVVRFWYHLLSEGGSGVNDHGGTYEVQAIGRAAAAEILFDAIAAGAFGASPDFNTARNATIQSALEFANNEFCSQAVGSVTNAWHAVGVGDKFYPDVSISGLNMTNANTIPVGGTFYAYYDLAANTQYLFDQETTVGFYLRSYCVGSNGLSFPFSIKIDEVECGKVTSHSTFLSLPSNIPAGNYYLMAKADAYNEITETNELNNSMCIPITIIEPVVLPDFVIETPSVNPSEVDAGSSFNISYRLRNIGTGYGGYTFTGCFLSTDATHSPNDVFLAGNFANGLLPGSASAVISSLTIPNGTSPGEYYIILQADYYDWREELNENNNYAAVRITVTGMQTPLPDLTISNVSPSPETGAPPLKSPGAWMSVRYDLVNLFGAVPPDPTTTSLFLSTDETLSMDDIALTTTGNQLPGTKAAVFQIPSNAAVNTYYKILIVADFANQQAEVLETNNVGIGHVVVYAALTGGDPGGDQADLETDLDAPSQTTLRVFPNPTRDQFTVAYSVQEEPIGISIFNATGQQLIQLSLEEAEQTGQWQYNGEQLPAGLYYIQWQAKKEVELLKLVVE